MINQVNHRLENIDFIATYSDKKIQQRNRFLRLCLTNPVGWVAGGLYLINELFKSVVLGLGRSTLFGSNKERKLRNVSLLEGFITEMKGKKLNLQSPDGRILEAMYIQAQDTPLNTTQQKTILLFTGSHRPYEFDASAMAKTYQTKGYNVLCINYGGFGLSKGSPSQSSIELDAETAYQYIKESYPGTEIYAHGYSLGSYPATYLGKSYNLNKIIIDRGFSKLSNVVKDEATKLFGRTAGRILELLVKYVGSLDNTKNIKTASSKFLFARADNDKTMLQYHVNLLKDQSKDSDILDFQGSHLHTIDSVWFQDNIKFWEWLANQ